MRALAFVSLLAAALVAGPVFAADGHGDSAPSHEHGAAHGEHGAAHGEHGAAHGEHGAAHGEHGAAAHGGHHVPTFDDINWFYGAFGEKEGVEPDFLFRPKGMPAPFGLWILNAVVLYGFLIKVARPKVRTALKNRKTAILKGMDEAARMKREAEIRLTEYEEKLAQIDQEVERVRREMREGAEAERARILSEAKARRARMEDDAKLLVEQELAAASATLRANLVSAALKSAAVSVQGKLRPEDQQRLADEYLSGIARAGSALRGRA